MWASGERGWKNFGGNQSWRAAGAGGGGGPAGRPRGGSGSDGGSLRGGPAHIAGKGVEAQATVGQATLLARSPVRVCKPQPLTMRYMEDSHCAARGSQTWCASLCEQSGLSLSCLGRLQGICGRQMGEPVALGVSWGCGHTEFGKDWMV